MNDMREKGKARIEIIVTAADTAEVLGSGLLPVLATPRVVALMEETACAAIAEDIPTGKNTVGTRIDIEHLSATPVGMRVWAEATLASAEGRAYTFQIEAFDEAGLIARATHTRFLVDTERFMQKTSAKKP